eukprot:Protomagalhaensia_sp_Gyna_25__4929@NODE_52_length_6070_cov_248_257005_g39_i0_p4_GENE_NODE_52_length_6070_cov_248_257005_g39_i0NODE_52_length_6070_cov_248_257005_g39_i0_p4_ORF_typecomplete_len141_score21_05Comm/PF15957_5/0_044Comm/PF15957_5/3_8e02_NODE_52_length_6070_cov_248_257005_g39_i019682390
MNDDSSDDGLYNLVNRLKGRLVSKQEENVKIDTTTKETSKHSSKPAIPVLASGLPTADEALSKVELPHKMQHEAFAKAEEQKRQAKESLEAKIKEKEAGKRTIYELPEISWHVPLTSFDYIKEIEEQRHKGAHKMARKES